MKTIHREEGFVLVTALLIMLVLTIIGIAATTNTSIELQIAGNDKVHKKTFYEAEAGAILGTEILEQAFNCASGFTETGPDYADLPDPNPKIRVYDRSSDPTSNNPTLWTNPFITNYSCDIGDQEYDAAYPITNLVAGKDEVGYLQFGGGTHMLPGGALQMAAGYEGKGKSAAQGGVARIFDIYSQFKGLNNSESIIVFGWRHLVGMEDTCKY